MKPLPVPDTDTKVWIGDPPPPLNDTSTIPYSQPKAGRVWPWVVLFISMLLASTAAGLIGIKIKSDSATTIKR